MASPSIIKALRDKEFWKDIGRNTLGVGELGLSMGTGMVDMAGRGLGTLAGMAGSKLRGEDIDWDAAAEAALPGGATYQPRTQGGQRVGEFVMAPFEAYDNWLLDQGGKVADVTGSPALGTAAYTAGSMIDPTILIPGGGATKGLRAASRAARSVETAPVPSTGFGGRQRGAWSYGDIADTEGDFSLRSPTMDAFDRLKPQEQTRLPGRQLIRALRREGASKEELRWSGLDRLLDTDEVISVADARAAAEHNAPRFEWEKQGGETEAGMSSSEFDDAVNERVSELVSEDSDLRYPEQIRITRGNPRWGDDIDTIYDDSSNFSETRWLREFEDAEFDRIQEEIMDEPEGYFSDRDLLDEYEAARSEGRGQEFIDEHAREAAANEASEVEFTYETDYDAEPLNYDELSEYWEGEVRGDPEGYGLERTDEPSYGEYTVSREAIGNGAGDDHYAVQLLNLESEGLYGRSRQPAYNQTTPGYVESYLDDPVLREREMARLDEREGLRHRGVDLDRARGGYHSSHYDPNMLFTRETRVQLEPDWATPEGLERSRGGDGRSTILEEAQSDVLQRGRKTGFYDPLDPKFREAQLNEKARLEAFRQQALAEAPQARQDPRVLETLENFRAKAASPDESVATVAKNNIVELEERVANIERARESGDIDALLEAERRYWSSLYRMTPAASPAEAFATQMVDGIDRLPRMRSLPYESAVPAAPLSETKQYMAMALRSRLAEAVERGEQFFAFTPGDIHSARWGSDSVQWAREPGNPDRVQLGTADYSGKRGRQEVEDYVRALRSGNANPRAIVDLNDPAQVERVMQQMVDSHLNYGTHDYPDPVAFRQKRARALAKMIREQESGHYSPRAFGNEMAYNVIERDLEKLLREAGSNAVIRDIELPNGQIIRGIEIDPALAQAAKRGFKLPY